MGSVLWAEERKVEDEFVSSTHQCLIFLCFALGLCAVYSCLVLLLYYYHELTLKTCSLLMAELRLPEGPPSGAPYSSR